MTLEDRLRRALRRVEPEPDFAERVMARIDAAPRAAASRPSRPIGIAGWALAASVVLAVALGALLAHQRDEDRRVRAGQQLALALELTSRELQNVHRHLEPLTTETEENGT